MTENRKRRDLFPKSDEVFSINTQSLLKGANQNTNKFLKK